MEIFDDIEQGSEQWYQLRLGIPTASIYKALIAGGDQRGRTTALYKLAGERITGLPMEKFTNAAMERGKEMEDTIRKKYEFERACDVRQVAFVRNGKTGCSPDGLIGDDGVLEMKSAEAHILIPMLLKGTFPNEHLAQCQGSLMVTERKWCDLIVYSAGMRPLIVRTERDELYIEKLRDAVDVFDLELRRLVERLK